MDKPYKIVVQGEASESDEDDEEMINEEPKSVVLEGEASESEEEELDTSHRPASKRELPPLKLSEHSTSTDSIEDLSGVPSLSYKQAGKPKYDTVLNKKLWEGNLSLCNNISGMASQSYLSAAKEITICSHQLSKSHVAIQDVSHNMRLMTNDLFNLHDHIDIVTTCTILPNICLPTRSAASPTSPVATSETAATTTNPSQPVLAESQAS